MVPIRGEWTPFADRNDQILHYRRWGLISEKSSALRPVMVVDGYWGAPQPCEVVGYQGDSWAVIRLPDGFHAIHGDYLAEMQPTACQRLPRGVCFADVLAKYIVLDIETTGFDLRRDRITEIAAHAYEYGEKAAEFHTYVNPERLIPANVITLTGITQEIANSAPILEDVESDFFEFIKDTPIIGHNILRFDVPFLNAWLSTPIENLLVDTLPMAQKVFDLLPCHKLDYLKSVLRLGDSESHRAFTDVETTNALLWACLAPRRYEQYVNAAFLDHRLNQSGAIKKSAAQSTLLSDKTSNAQDSSLSPKKVQGGKRQYGNGFAMKHSKIDIKSIVPTDIEASKCGLLSGKNIVFTGELSISRSDAMQMAVDAGATLKTSVSGKTNYLVVGTQDSTLVKGDGISGKEAKAYELNRLGTAKIEILHEAEFLALVRKDGVPV